MSRLLIRLNGQQVAELALEDGNEYLIGRGEDCAIVLKEQRGISRHHIRIAQRDGFWTATGLSRFGPLQRDGASLEVIELNTNCIFYASPYEFHFEVSQTIPPEGAADGASPTAQLAGIPAPFQANYEPAYPAQSMDDTAIRGNIEATVAGIVYLVAFLRVQYKETGEEETLKLEGDLWVAGRENASEICLRDGRVSRKQFELSRTREGFFVTDLGSSNGTKLNGQSLVAHEPTRLESGDTLTVLQIEMLFEIRDVNFTSRMQNLPAPAPMFNPPGMWQPQIPANAMYDRQLVPTLGDPNQMVNWAAEKSKKIDWKKNKVRIALIAFVPILLYGLLQNSKPEPKRDPAAKAESVTFEHLSPEQKSAVKDTFSLARSLYVQGKYELCLAETAKLHEMLPFYENSKEIEAFCSQGRELVLRQKDSDRREREKALLEQQITAVIDGCKEKLKASSTVDETRQCLSAAMELNPDHPTVREMIGAAQSRQEEQKLLREHRATVQARTEKGLSVYRKAKELYKQQKLADALKEYQKFLATNYPNIESTKETARREISSIKKELETKVNSFLAQCKTLGEKGHYKEAYIACDNALKEDPDNTAAQAVRKSMLSNLRREVKSIYEDSVLEESLGNVDSAKEKWKKIVADDLDFDEYSKKSKILLRKYGVE
jgi:pSer/pThr/pTyr-binding forkhead associated (FHA) protein/tetratricopeptide (TPR) repeat protein